MMIEAKNIQKSFGSLKVLKGIDFQAEKSEVVSIMGASGAGKSTLLQILGTLSSPDGGSLVIDGIDVLGLDRKAMSASISAFSFGATTSLTSLSNDACKSAAPQHPYVGSYLRLRQPI